MTDRMRSRVVTGLVLAGVGATIAIGWAKHRRFSPVEAGAPAPEYAAPSLAGDTVSLRSLRGRVVLLNVWATWCAPCRAEMPALDRLYHALRDDGLEVVAVNVDAPVDPLGAVGDPAAGVRAFVRELGLDFRILLDPRAEVQRRFGVAGLPTTFLIARDGRVAEKVLGPARWDEPPYAGRVRRLLER